MDGLSDLHPEEPQNGTPTTLCFPTIALPAVSSHLLRTGSRWRGAMPTSRVFLPETRWR